MTAAGDATGGRRTPPENGRESRRPCTWTILLLLKPKDGLSPPLRGIASSIEAADGGSASAMSSS